MSGADGMSAGEHRRGRAEGITDVTRAEPALIGVSDDLDDVEPYGPLRRAVARQPEQSDPREPALFGRSHRLRWEAVPGRPPRLDLDEYDCVGVEGHEVDLAEAAAKSPFNDRHAGAEQHPLGSRLPSPTQLLAGVR